MVLTSGTFFERTVFLLNASLEPVLLWRALELVYALVFFWPDSAGRPLAMEHGLAATMLSLIGGKCSLDGKLGSGNRSPVDLRQWFILSEQNEDGGGLDFALRILETLAAHDLLVPSAPLASEPKAESSDSAATNALGDLNQKVIVIVEVHFHSMICLTSDGFAQSMAAASCRHDIADLRRDGPHTVALQIVDRLSQV
jgi:hypothetical protein